MSKPDRADQQPAAVSWLADPRTTTTLPPPRTCR